jgi:hypothetical protein
VPTQYVAEQHDFGIDAIRRNTHYYRKSRIQTLAGEQRLRDRGESTRDELHLRATWSPEVMIDKGVVDDHFEEILAIPAADLA